MRETLYDQNTANYPRIKTDCFFADYNNTYKYDGFFDKVFTFVEDFQLLNPNLWRRFVQQFREDADFDAGWRGEYWGKMMRGAAMVYAYSHDAVLYEVLCNTVRDLLTVAESDGRVSSYSRDTEFKKIRKSQR